MCVCNLFGLASLHAGFPGLPMIIDRSDPAISPGISPVAFYSELCITKPVGHLKD